MEADKLRQLYKKPHNKISRQVKESDLFRVDKDGDMMYELLTTPVGFYPGGMAIAHMQIEDIDPLQFFVTKDEVVINPELLDHTKVKVRKVEGCLSFHWNKFTVVERYNKIKVKYYTMIEVGGKLQISGEIVRDLSGLEAQAWQHELDHLEGKNIYSVDIKKDI